MFTLYAIFVFIFGLIIGSFLNVVIFRIDDLKTIWFTRSHCQNCKKILKWYDLAPLFSYLALGGKCRFCKAKISAQYPIVEFFTAVSFLLLFLMLGLTISLFFYLIVFSILIVVFVYDLKFQMVPEPFVWAALVLALLGSWYFGNFGVWSMILGGLVGGGIPAFLVLVSKERWMGAGDIKIGAILGVLCGYPVVFFGMFLAFLVGAIVGLVYIKIASKTIKAAMPFAPFLIFAAYISVMYGAAIVSWYWGGMYLR